MKNLILVIDSNEKYAKELAAYSKDNGFFYDSAYALNGEEGFELFTILLPDVVVLDYMMPVLDGIGFLRKLKFSGIKKKPVIIMNSHSNITSMISAAVQYGVDYFMIKPQPFEDMCSTARELLNGAAESVEAKEEKNDLEKSVTMFLRTLGMPAHLDGYKYMRSAILFTLNDPGVISPITKKLYPMIAEMYKTNKSCVERALRHAIEVSWQRGNKKLIHDIFGYSCDSSLSRPTNAEYIAMAADDLRLRIKHGML